MYLREKYVQYSVLHHGSTNGCSCQCLCGNFCRGSTKTTAMRYWASRAFVYTNAQSHGSRRCRKPWLCLLGCIPNPLNSVSRWLRLCEPYHFFKKRETMKTQKSAGTVRSRRCQSAKKGLGGGSHQQAKREVSAQAVISRFSHLWPQMPCLPLCVFVVFS